MPPLHPAHFPYSVSPERIVGFCSYVENPHLCEKGVGWLASR
ncbi:hypothetical protein M3J09_002045 [Ascochyta lentis]